MRRKSRTLERGRIEAVLKTLKPAAQEFSAAGIPVAHSFDEARRIIGPGGNVQCGGAVEIRTEFSLAELRAAHRWLIDEVVNHAAFTDYDLKIHRHDRKHIIIAFTALDAFLKSEPLSVTL